MRTIIFSLSLAVLMSMQSCKEDFTVSAPYRQITFVAGILDQSDSAHYIRIQKAFMDEYKSAITMSKIPDSSFYDSLTVKLYEYDNSQAQVLDSVLLRKVDMNNEGYQKLEPINDQQFFTSPNYGYKFTNQDIVLDAQKWYRLVILNDISGRADSSEFVGIVNSDPNRAQQGFYVVEFANAGYTVDFARTTPSSIFKIRPYMPRNGRTIEGYIRFHYEEKNVATNQVTRDSADFPFATEKGAIPAGQSFELGVPNADIYGFLISAIGPAPDNIERYMDSCDVYVYAGSPELFYDAEINLGQSGGITNNNIKPNFTNFKGDNAIGILGSRAKRVYTNAGIGKVTLDSLMNNPLIAPLRIRGVSEH